MSAVLVSVIIPTFNSDPEFLKKAIESVLSQTYTDIEIIVVDDASAVPFAGLEGFFNDSRVVWVRNTSNVGVSATRNYGVSVSRGEFLAFLDSDDWWAKDKLMLQLRSLQLNSTAWCYTTTVLCDSIGTPLSLIKAEHSGYIYEELLKAQIVAGSCSGVVVRRQAFFEAGMFDDSGDTEEDWDMWLRLSRNFSISCVDVPLVYLRTFSDSRSNLLEGKLARLKRFQEKYYSQYVLYDLTLYAKAHFFYIASRQYFISRRYISAFRYLCLSFVSCPSYYSSEKLFAMKEKILSYIYINRKIR